MIQFGKISEVNDDGTVRVEFSEDDSVSGILQCVYSRTSGAKQWHNYKVGELAVCLFDEDRETGVVLGVVYNKVQTVSNDNPTDGYRFEFEDGSFIQYSAGVGYEIDVVGDLLLDATDQIIMNGGANGGIAVVGDLVTQYNAIQSDINQLKTLLSSIVAVPQDGGAAILLALAPWAGSSLALTNDSDIENIDVLH